MKGLALEFNMLFVIIGEDAGRGREKGERGLSGNVRGETRDRQVALKGTFQVGPASKPQPLSPVQAWNCPGPSGTRKRPDGKQLANPHWEKSSPGKELLH